MSDQACQLSNTYTLYKIIGFRVYNPALTLYWAVIHVLVTDKIIIITNNDKKECITVLAFFSRLEVKSVCERTFHNTGLFYFHLENCDADWTDDDISSFCLVKVAQTDRYIVKFVNCIFRAVNSCSVNWIVFFLLLNYILVKSCYLRHLLNNVFTIGHQNVKCHDLVLMSKSCHINNLVI